MKVNINMPKLWIMALDSYAKSNGFKNRAQVIRSLFYPAFQKELRLLEPEVKIEPLIEKKKAIKKYSVSKRFKKALKLIIKNSPKTTMKLTELKKASSLVIKNSPETHRKFSEISNFIRERRALKQSSTVQLDKKYIETAPIRVETGYKKPKKKKEWLVSVPRRVPLKTLSKHHLHSDFDYLSQGNTSTSN